MSVPYDHDTLMSNARIRRASQDHVAALVAMGVRFYG